MNGERGTAADERLVTVGADSQLLPTTSSGPRAELCEAELLQKLLWNVEEVAFITRVSRRTVWRMASDPRSGFPKPRRLRGRTLFVRDELLAFLQGDSAR